MACPEMCTCEFDTYLHADLPPPKILAIDVNPMAPLRDVVAKVPGTGARHYLECAGGRLTKDNPRPNQRGLLELD